jgi:hypothetical protein
MEGWRVIFRPSYKRVRAVTGVAILAGATFFCGMISIRTRMGVVFAPVGAIILLAAVSEMCWPPRCRGRVLLNLAGGMGRGFAVGFAVVAGTLVWIAGLSDPGDKFPLVVVIYTPIGTLFGGGAGLVVRVIALGIRALPCCGSTVKESQHPPAN